MNIINSYRFGESTPVIERNTFIGGVGSTINTPALLAAKLSIGSASIQNFQVVGNNIECLIEVDYLFVNSAFSSNSSITYYIDVDNKILNFGWGVSFGFSAFYATENLEHFIAGGNVTSIARNFFYGDRKVKEYYFKNLTDIDNASFASLDTGFKIYLPVATSIYSLAFSTGASLAGVTGYFNDYLATSNGGGIDAGVAYFISKGGTVVWVANTTPSNDVNDLSASNILTTSVQLNFTPPASTNALDFYEVYIDDGTSNPIQLYTVFKEISGSGQVLSGLTSETTYKIQVVACDEFWNRSGRSNEITITTGIIIPSLIVSYPLHSDSSEVIGITAGINGTDTAMSYNGSEASFNGASSYITLPDNDVFSFKDGSADTPFSIEFVVNLNSIHATEGVWLIDKRENALLSEWQCYYYQGAIGFMLLSPITTINNLIRINSSFSFPLNQDVKIKMTYNGNGVNGLNIFIDDVVLSVTRTTSGVYTGMKNETNKVTIGRRGWSGAAYLDGAMRDLKFYNYEKLT